MKILKYIFLAVLLIPFASCDIDDLPNPNGSSTAGFDMDATNGALQTLVTGMEDLLRQEVGFYYDLVSIVGREYYFFTGSDPRFTGEILGRGDSQLDNAGFYGTRPYFGRYRTVRTANVLIDGASNSTLLTTEELNGYLGFARTFQAYELLLVANLQFENGIRIDVTDSENLGPFVDYNAALTAIQSLLSEAATNLNSAGDAFAFNLSTAMENFSDPQSFLGFNRGLAARVSLYQGDMGGALTNLASSFMDIDGDLMLGAARFYSTAGGDFANVLFRVPDQADGIIAHPSFVEDALEGDNRLNKVLLRPSGPLRLDDLSGEFDVVRYQSLSDVVPYMRNEELVLIFAEANASSNPGEAVRAINAVRSFSGLPNYDGAMDAGSLLDEVLFQRRYSLFAEGHRWIDNRRTGRLGTLPIDRVGDDVWVQLPRPVSEVGG